MKKRTWWVIGIVAVIVVVGVSLFFIINKEKTPYEIICDDGYQGSAEEFIASLVGEQHAPGVEVSSYAIACEKGYEKSLDQWMQTLTGTTTADASNPAYTVACENGYDGTLAQWVDTLVPNPEQLGKSQSGTSKTEYELACEYGFEGSFSEWMVSLANETINN